MATTNHTPHYNLPQWATGDKVGILANLNPAFDTIDSNLFEATTNSEAAVNTANNASQVATSASQAVNELQPDVLKNGADILTLQNYYNNLNQLFNNSQAIETVNGTWNSEYFSNEGNPAATTKILGGKTLSLYGYAHALTNKTISNGTVLISGLKKVSERKTIYASLFCNLEEGSRILNCFLNTDGTLTINGEVNTGNLATFYLQGMLIL